ncbi:putative mechanosensitive channel protein [Cedecea neteri]|uniref:Putative mechanosensitive channel protein n=1 Tax=Cedecea neteri TaxID=158822 RepID=A0A2X2V7X3_9ENTR|nr:putative mechanosensitive channel protein [Cedecea neteri]
MQNKSRRNWSRLRPPKNTPNQAEIVEALQSALNALDERKASLERAEQYQQVIDNFPKLSQTLRKQLTNLRDEPEEVPPGMSSDALNQEIFAGQQPASGQKAVLPSRSRKEPATSATR